VNCKTLAPCESFSCLNASTVVDGKMIGGFAFGAYPAEYGNSGVMTFIINQDGVLLQKDLGKTTTETAQAITEFDPDTTWSVVEE